MHLLPGESAQVVFYIRREDISVWDAPSHSFTVVAGRFQAYIGSSSRDIRLKGWFDI